jgi:hypothetical protein
MAGLRGRLEVFPATIFKLNMEFFPMPAPRSVMSREGCGFIISAGWNVLRPVFLQLELLAFQ